MRYAIPRYRLPREVLDAEIDRILALGVHLETGAEVTDLDALLAEERFDAVLLALGARLARRTYLPAGAAAHVLDALTVLRSTAEEEPPLLGRRVAVYGGGNTALDAARTAKRLGADEALVVYRRTRERMPAHDQEVRRRRRKGSGSGGCRPSRTSTPTGITIEEMELDETGFPQPTGRTTRLAADSVVLALGQDTDLALLGQVPGIAVNDGVVTIDPVTMATNRPGVFAAGDVAPGERSVTVAVGHGRRAAAGIDAYLTGTTVPAPAPVDLAPYEALNTWYFEDAPRQHRPRLEQVRRQSTFDEVVQDLDAGHGALRGAPLSLVWWLHLVRQLLRSLPGQRRDQARPREGVRRRPRLLQGLRAVRRGVPDGLDDDGARGGLTSPGSRPSRRVMLSRPPPSRGSRC